MKNREVQLNKYGKGVLNPVHNREIGVNPMRSRHCKKYKRCVIPLINDREGVFVLKKLQVRRPAFSKALIDLRMIGGVYREG
jgi:hypothetical protein